MDQIRVAVIGAGKFGGYHASKYSLLPTAKLVGIVDHDLERAEALAAKHQVAAFNSIDALYGRIDAASVAVTSSAHFDIASLLIENGIHVLIEKPMAARVEEAEKLIALAKTRGVKIQVGHLERFNPVISALEGEIIRPQFIESVRLSGFQARVTDVNVVLDLMIHDIDLIQFLMRSKVTWVDSCGVPILSDKDDMVSARLHFENGCIANVSASRISFRSERRMRIFQKDTYISIDFQATQATIARKAPGEQAYGLPDIAVEERRFEQTDALLLEVESFIEAIRGRRDIAVTGEDGLAAIRTAQLISDTMIRPAGELQE